MDRALHILDMPLRWLRRLVYALGFRPVLGSVLFSPTLHTYAITKGAAQAFVTGYNKAVRELPVLIHLPADRLGLSHIPITLKTVYASMRFCPMCGSELQDYIMDMKECPNGHGKAEPEDDSKGLPAIVFHPYAEA